MILVQRNYAEVDLWALKNKFTIKRQKKIKPKTYLDESSDITMFNI